MTFDELHRGHPHDEGEITHRTTRDAQKKEPAEQLKDEALVQRCVQEGGRAWNEFFRRFHKTIQKAIIAKLTPTYRKNDIIDDITQHVRISIVDNLKNWDSQRGELKGWLHVLAQRRVIDWLRTYDLHARAERRKKRKNEKNPEMPGIKILSLDDPDRPLNVADTATDAETMLADADLSKKLDTLAKQILDKRELFIWQKAIKEDLNLRDIGKELNLTESMISKLVKGIKEKMTAAAQKEWEDTTKAA